jgi:predicted PurR-regulated permease PerM
MRAFLPFDRERLIQVFFFAAFAWVIYQLFLLMRPFLPGLLAAVMLAVAFHPFKAWIQRRIKNRHLAALTLCLGVLLVVILPLFIVGQVIVREASRLLPVVQELLEDIQNHNLGEFQQHIPSYVQGLMNRGMSFLQTFNIDIKGIVLENASRIGAIISSSGIFLARHALFALFNGVVMMVLLFFAFRDGELYYKRIITAIPMRTEHKEALAARAYEIFRAVTIGVLATAAAQGFVATIGYLIAGVRLPLLLGMATGLVSLLGASVLVTLPVALSMFGDSVPRGIFLLIWGGLVVGLLDNFLKPILIGSQARMPFVLIFFSILGGIKLYGLLGIILGPMLVATFLTFLKIYQEEYRL